MRVLMIAPYIYEKKLKEFTINETGFGIMVRNIAESVGNISELLLMTRVIINQKKIKSYKIISHTWFQILTQARLKNWINGIFSFFKTKGSLKEKLRQFFYDVDEGYIETQIKKYKPDIVHIHGIGMITQNYINVCKRLKIKYVVTLHGLIGLDESVKASTIDKNLERNFLKESLIENIPVTVISSGIKSRIENNYLNSKRANNIKVILNGARQNKKQTKKYVFNRNFNVENYIKEYKSILEKNSFPELSSTYNCINYYKKNNKKILFAIGNITKNKNQIEIIKAFSKIDRDDIIVFLFGNERDDQEVRKEILKNKLEEKVILAGYCDELDIIWELADLNILLSLNEGFGLSIIEGYMHGVPSILFSDIDAANDIFNINSCLLISKRTTQEVINNIEKALNTRWEKEKIKNFGKEFLIDQVAENYLKLYKNVIEV